MLKDRMAKVKKMGIPVGFFLGAGSPTEEIVKIARSTNTSLIIIGSRQLKSLDKIKTLGRVARKVSKTAHCPTMIIR